MYTQHSRAILRLQQSSIVPADESLGADLGPENGVEWTGSVGSCGSKVRRGLHIPPQGAV